MELISERAAARLLAACGLSLSASQHLLATGIAGQPLRTAAATLYESGPSAALLARFWRGRSVPLLMTVSGVVLCGATATGFAPTAERGGEFDACFALEAPGPWLGRAGGRMLGFGRGATIELLGDLSWVRNDRSGRSAARARR